MNISKKAIMSFIVAFTSVISMAQPYYHIMKEENGKLTEEIGYNGKDYNIKIDMNKPKPKDAIGGEITIEHDWFCIGPKLRSFYFTKHGNIYYDKDKDKFYFEKSQLDYARGYIRNHIGHFKWGQTIDDCTELGPVEGGIFYFADPKKYLPKLQEDLGNEKWALLNSCEWEYVCEILGECGWTVDGKTCFLIDTTPDKSLLRAIESKNGGKTMTKEDFESYEAQGLVCLPAAGSLNDWHWNINGVHYYWYYEDSSLGYYWSCYSHGDVYSMDFNSSRAGVYHSKRSTVGYAVRLVILADD